MARESKIPAVKIEIGGKEILGHKRQQNDRNLHSCLPVRASRVAGMNELSEITDIEGVTYESVG